MRVGYHDAGFIEADRFIGVNLGYDFCAEHEYGVRGIQEEFGVGNTKAFGIQRRKITRLPKALFLSEVQDSDGRTYHQLVFDRWYNRAVGLHPDLDYPTLRERQGFVTAWDDESFGLLVTDQHKDKLAELYHAFQRHDVAIFLGARLGPFSNQGLVLAIASRLPLEVTESMRVADEDHDKLMLVFKQTGIEEYLRSRGKKWFALRPRWANESKTELRFWLNPFDQDRYEAGWYSLEDLKAWAEDRGPIVKSQK